MTLTNISSTKKVSLKELKAKNPDIKGLSYSGVPEIFRRFSTFYLSKRRRITLENSDATLLEVHFKNLASLSSYFFLGEILP